MNQEEVPQIYLVTPPEIELQRFPDDLARLLDRVDVACLRLSLATRDEDRLMRTADALREVSSRADVALVIDTHTVLADRLALDGVHLPDGTRSVRAARKALGPDAIVGAFCGTSQHDGLSAGEAGADYVSFGPVSGALGSGAVAGRDLFAWWSEMIEVPVVAEGGLTPERVATLSEVVDFLAVGEEIWEHEDPASALTALLGR